MVRLYDDPQTEPKLHIPPNRRTCAAHERKEPELYSNGRVSRGLELA